MRTSKMIVAGIDEAGRGPLAGPVVAAAVALLPLPRFGLGAPRPNLGRLGKLKDSKQLSAKQREEYYELFIEHPGIQWGIGKVGERVIDRINIYQATRVAMERAVVNLSKKTAPSFLFVDGTMKLKVSIPQKALVRGDETLELCAAASIIAKVHRDRLMLGYHKKYPGYGFDQHKGYGTKAHLTALKVQGPCPIHRMTFHPCRDARSVIF